MWGYSTFVSTGVAPQPRYSITVGVVKWRQKPSTPRKGLCPCFNPTPLPERYSVLDAFPYCPAPKGAVKVRVLYYLRVTDSAGPIDASLQLHSWIAPPASSPIFPLAHIALDIREVLSSVISEETTISLVSQAVGYIGVPAETQLGMLAHRNYIAQSSKLCRYELP